MSPYKPYPAYRDSGVEWIGQVPEHWNKMPFKRVASIRNGRDYKEIENADGAYPVIGSGGEFARASDFMFDGESVLLGRKGTIDKPLYINGPFWAVDTMFYTKIADDAFPKFVYYSALTIPFGLYSTNTALPSMAGEDLSSHVVVAPKIEEQKTIAVGVDRETARIDALITKKTRFIELLKEKRQAIITHAVTQGLDPNATMKDSGVEWIGEVPEHWGITRIKHATLHVVDCLHTTPTYGGNVQFPAVRTADIDRGRLFLDQTRLVSRDVYEERIQRMKPLAGDILYSREGERFGMAALVPEGVDLCLGQRMMMFRIHPTSDSAYIMWVLNSDSVYQQVVERTGGSTSPHVNISDVINFHIPIPPLAEQQQIATHIQKSMEVFDAITAKSQCSIDLLKERRAAFITAAVTGQIDLRESA